MSGSNQIVSDARCFSAFAISRPVPGFVARRERSAHAAPATTLDSRDESYIRLCATKPAKALRTQRGTSCRIGAAHSSVETAHRGPSLSAHPQGAIRILRSIPPTDAFPQCRGRSGSCREDPDRGTRPDGRPRSDRSGASYAAGHAHRIPAPARNGTAEIETRRSGDWGVFGPGIGPSDMQRGDLERSSAESGSLWLTCNVGFAWLI